MGIRTDGRRLSRQRRLQPGGCYGVTVTPSRHDGRLIGVGDNDVAQLTDTERIDRLEVAVRAMQATLQVISEKLAYLDVKADSTASQVCDLADSLTLSGEDEAPGPEPHDAWPTRLAWSLPDPRRRAS